MTAEQQQIVGEALAPYDATLDAEGYIVRRNRRLPVRVAVERKRLLFIGANGQALATGTLTGAFVRQFVERFWFWQPHS